MTGRLGEVLASGAALLGVPDTADTLGLGPALAARLGLPVEQLVVLLVDGFGYHLLPAAAASAPLVRAVLAGEAGELRELASPFPSTTPTSLVTLGTGVESGTHGVLGFTVAIPGTDDVLTHVTWRRRPAPRSWQPVVPLPDRAVAAGVATTLVTRREFRHSGLTVAAYGASPRYLAADSLDAVIDAVRVSLRDGDRLVYAYHPDLDWAMHGHGIGSPEWFAAAGEVDQLVRRLAAGLPPAAALLVTADHGGLNVPMTSRFDVADEAGLGAGVRVIAGEPRVRHVYCRPGAAAEVQDRWAGWLGDAAEVVLRADAVAAGWFGPVPEAHAERIGDVVAVCTGDAAIFASGWGEPDRVRTLVGYHGALTPAERAVPLISLTAADGA